MLALSSSHRGVRLHTFEPEDRAYTSTPTKIGGHALDHVVGVTLAWSRTLNSKRSSNGRARCRRAALAAAGDRDGDGDGDEDAGAPAACSTTLEPSMGRFGGLSLVTTHHSPAVHRRHLPQQPASTMFVFPPDTLAPRSMLAAGAGESRWPREYGPEWAGRDAEANAEAAAVAVAVAPLLDSPNAAAATTSMKAARSGAAAATSRRALPYRDMATAATGHSGALMAVLLSKLANGGYSGCSSSSSSSSSTGAAAADTAGAASASDAQPEAPAAAAAAALSRTELLHRSVDTIARGLDNIAGADLAVPVAADGVVGGGSWAWKARVDQTPRYSKLRRYDFIRELGSGGHGTILLVRKRPAAASDHQPPSISDGVLDASSKRGETISSGGGTRSPTTSSSSIIDDSSSSSNSSSGGVKRSNRGSGGTSERSTTPGDLRVLKESPFLPEAVNEARLLLLAGGGDGGGGFAGAVASGPGSSRGRAAGAGAGIGVGAGDVGVGGGVTAAASDGGGKGCHQRGEVVQVRTLPAAVVFVDRIFAETAVLSFFFFSFFALLPGGTVPCRVSRFFAAAARGYGHGRLVSGWR